MELFFLALLVILMATALGSGFPVAFALPGSAILTIGLAAGTGYLFAGDTDAYFYSGGPSEWLSAGVTNLRGVYWEVERDTLIAIPMFIFMGIMLQRSKIAEDLLVTMAQLFGPVPGGLGISVVFVGALLAATTGIVGATVVAMGLISLPAMLRNKYSPSLATGVIASSGTLGQIIPPSIVLIILADQLASATDQASAARKALYRENTGELTMPSVFDVSSTSAGEMFLGAFVPGLLLVLIYMLYILVVAILRPSAAPPVRFHGRFDVAFWSRVFLTLVPPLALIFMVLGSIIGGIATVNQAGTIGAVGALVMAGYRLTTKSGLGAFAPAILALLALAVLGFALNSFDMNLKAADDMRDYTGLAIGALGSLMLITALAWSGWRVLKTDRVLHQVMLETAKTTSLVFTILLGAAMLTAAFRAFGGEDLIRDFLDSLPGGFWTQFIIVMGVIFLLGFFLDFIEIAVVVVPIVAPILLADPSANITAVWLGVMIGLNIQTSFLTPPFGFALFYLRGVAPAVVRTVQMYRGVVAFICLQLVALGVVGVFPQLVNYLPNRVSFLSETSPPPRNPRLQLCIEEYVGEKLARDSAVQDAVARMKGVDLSSLPTALQQDLQGSVGQAEKAMQSLTAAFASADVVTAAAKNYRPLLQRVRRLEHNARKLEAQAEELRVIMGRMPGPDQDAAKAELQQQREGLLAEAARLKAKIPAGWTDAYTEFATLTKAENSARNLYRRSADAAYERGAGVLAILTSSDDFRAVEADLRALRSVIEARAPKAAQGTLAAFERRLKGIAGSDDVRAPLSKARRALKVRGGKQPDRAKALDEFAKAIAAYEAQLPWRARVGATVVDEVTVYLDAIRGVLGIRVQPKLNREQALYLAACQAGHRNLSLNF